MGMLQLFYIYFIAQTACTWMCWRYLEITIYTLKYITSANSYTTYVFCDQFWDYKKKVFLPIKRLLPAKHDYFAAIYSKETVTKLSIDKNAGNYSISIWYSKLLWTLLCTDCTYIRNWRNILQYSADLYW